jgi:hypothetical protein
LESEQGSGEVAKARANLNRKLRREVTTISRMTHKNIVRYYQAWVEGGNRHLALPTTTTQQGEGADVDNEDDVSPIQLPQANGDNDKLDDDGSSDDQLSTSDEDSSSVEKGDDDLPKGLVAATRTGDDDQESQEEGNIMWGDAASDDDDSIDLGNPFGMRRQDTRRSDSITKYLEQENDHLFDVRPFSLLLKSRINKFCLTDACTSGNLLFSVFSFAESSFGRYG